MSVILETGFITTLINTHCPTIADLSSLNRELKRNSQRENF